MTTEGQEPTKDKPQAGTEPTTPPQAGKVAETAVSPANDDAQMFPLDYVQQLRQEAANYRTQIKKQEAAQQKAREAELAQKEEWKQLAEERAAQLAEYTPIKEQYEAMIDNLKASNEKRIETVPEDRRSLIPEYSDPSKLAAWLDANAALLSMKPQAPNIDGAAGTGQRPGASPVVLSDDEIAIAKKMGMTPEQYAESKAKIAKRND